MTREQLLLTMLMEECNETAQRASKAIRFGLDEVQDGQMLNNAQRIVYEFNDIFAVMEILLADKHISKIIDFKAIMIKREKIESWLKYSGECGVLDN